MSLQGLHALYESHGITPPKQKSKPYGGRPKFVRLAPGDKGDYLPYAFFEDPRDYHPQPGPQGQIHAWGIYGYDFDFEEDRDPKRGDETDNWPHYDGLQSMYRQMHFQFVYGGKENPSPESQWMKVILEKKSKQLKTVNLNGLDKCDVLCKIKLAGLRNSAGQDRIWRRFRVSAGINLATLQDKVIAPIMGWVRNYHCYTFTDYRDGALFGPENMAAIDRAHSAQIGYDYLPDERYKFAHLFEKQGDNVGYLYDFGDKWQHDIEILKIFPKEDSTGEVKIIDGVGSCPGENMQGNINYEDFLNEYDTDTPTEKLNKKLRVLAETNYKGFTKGPAHFDPGYFDRQAAEDRLSAALSSNQSVRIGAKSHTVPTCPHVQEEIDRLDKVHLPKGNTYKKEYDESGGPGYWKEMVSTTRDSRKKAVCASCGRPAAEDVQLKTCSGCRMVMYCSAAHQKDHWKRAHKAACSRAYLK